MIENSYLVLAGVVVIVWALLTLTITLFFKFRVKSLCYEIAVRKLKSIGATDEMLGAMWCEARFPFLALMAISPLLSYFLIIEMIAIKSTNGLVGIISCLTFYVPLSALCAEQISCQAFSNKLKATYVAKVVLTYLFLALLPCLALTGIIPNLNQFEILEWVLISVIVLVVLCIVLRKGSTRNWVGNNSASLAELFAGFIGIVGLLGIAGSI